MEGAATKKRGNPYRDANGKFTTRAKGGNPYHDKAGKFSSHSGTGPVKGTDQQKWAEEATSDLNHDGALSYATEGYNDPVSRPLIGIAHHQGFDGLPIKGDVDKAIADGGIEIHRGLSRSDRHKVEPEELEHNLKDGKYEPGKGNYGSGYYFSTSSGIAKMYADAPVAANGYSAKSKEKGIVTRAALHKDAKIIGYDELQAEHKAWFAENKDRIHWNTYETDFIVPKGKMSPSLVDFANDPGHFAALRGYDAIRVPLKNRDTDRRNKARIKKKIGSDDLGDEIVVINRTALVVNG